MNRTSWSADERSEYDALCEDAMHYSSSTAKRTARYVDLLRDAEQAQRYFAKDCLDDALHRGAAAQLKRWRANKPGGRVPVSYKGELLLTRRVIGSVGTGEDGAPIHTQCLFDYLTWEQLEEKAREYVSNIQAFRRNLHTVTRLLELRELVPAATTPAEAARILGTTIERFLAMEVPA